jgi:large subunit ribosomal protein L6
MSRIGKKPIVIPSGVKVEQKGQVVKVTGPKGTLEMNCNTAVTVKVDGSQILVDNPDMNDRFKKAMHGTTRALLNNMIVGVTAGYQQDIQIFGTGYNVKELAGKLVLTVGYCNPVSLPIPKGVKVEIKIPATKGNEVPALFSVLSMDKHDCGQFAADVRRVRPPEPYQGKGIRFADEHITRKEGKAFASGSGG